MKNTSNVGYSQFSLFTRIPKGGPQGQVSYLGLWQEQNVGEMYTVSQSARLKRREQL
jgi:hypothetical protein